MVRFLALPSRQASLVLQELDTGIIVPMLDLILSSIKLMVALEEPVLFHSVMPMVTLLAMIVPVRLR
jgi:hypothetical protein